MNTVTQHQPSVNHDLADLMTQAYTFGHEDATEGHDQRGSTFFHPSSAGWDAYNEGYAAGCIAVGVLTGAPRGLPRTCWIPQGVTA